MEADTAPKAGDGIHLERPARAEPPIRPPSPRRGGQNRLFGRRECLPTTAHALPAPTAVTTHAAASPVPIALATAKATAFAA
jgi:hypothetical protein